VSTETNRAQFGVNADAVGHRGGPLHGFLFKSGTDGIARGVGFYRQRAFSGTGPVHGARLERMGNVHGARSRESFLSAPLLIGLAMFRLVCA
jgi:hypothetical protein